MSVLRDELTSLNAIRRTFQNNGLPKTASCKLAVSTLSYLKKKADAGSDDEGGGGNYFSRFGKEFPDISSALVGAGLGGLAGVGYQALRKPKFWEPKKTLNDYLWSAGAGAGLGGLAVGGYEALKNLTLSGDEGDSGKPAPAPMPTTGPASVPWLGWGTGLGGGLFGIGKMIRYIPGDTAQGIGGTLQAIGGLGGAGSLIPEYYYGWPTLKKIWNHLVS